MLPFVDSLFLSLSLVVGKRRLFNCLEEKIAVSTSLSLSPFPTSRLPISFEAKLQFGRTVIFQIRPCSNAQKNVLLCFRFTPDDPSYMIAVSEWLLKRDVLNSTQPGQNFTLQLSRSWFTPLRMSAITLKCRFVEGAQGERGGSEEGWELHFGNALFARFSQPKTATRSLAKRINKTDTDDI